MPATECTLDIHKEAWDLGGLLTAQFFNAAGEESLLVHENQSLRAVVTIKFTGRILHYLCNTEICVKLAFESCGGGPEGDFHQWKTLTPCETDTYVFDFNVPGGVLTAGECGTQYELCITLGSKDCCGKVGFIFGTCKDLSITVMPTDAN